MKVVKAPDHPDWKFRLFLAGSIDMGKAVDWQANLTEDLSWVKKLTILNPRRDDWDSSWVQSIDNPEFYEQVTWELDMLCAADLIVLYLAEGTLSPISLLELGLFANSGKVIIYCTDKFWRKGNVDIVAERYYIPVCESYLELIDEIEARLDC
jgi:hypothetical protein